MPLQIRRGPTADRLANTPLVGELVYDTTTGSIYVGNGTTAGGLAVTNFGVVDAQGTTARMFLGDSLSDNTVHSGITFAFVGNRLQATVQQDLSNYIGQIRASDGFKGNLVSDDSGVIVNSDTHTVYGNFVPQGDIIPDTNIAYDLGSAAYRFRDLYLSGSSIYLGNAVLTSTGTAIDLPLGTTVAGNPIGFDENATYGITISGNVIAQDSTVLVDTTNGAFNGDLYGSVFGWDSTILVDARDGVLRGTLIGALTGNVTGNVTGNAGTVTNGVYTLGDQTIAGTKTFSSTISGSITGSAGSATVASTITLTATDTSANPHYLSFVAAATGNEPIRTDASLFYVPTSNELTAGTFVGNLTGNVTGNLTGTASSATLASTVTLVPTNSSASAHYITFTQNPSGDEGIRSDTSLTYQPSTNTLATGIINATTVNATSVSATSITGNIFTSLIDTADSSAITVTPAIVFNSDVTVDNELLVGNIFPTTSESYNLGSYTKKFGKLYLTEGDNALWIGNAAISGNGTIVNLPAGSTVGGSAITTAAGSNATTITVNTTGTNADYFVSFFDDQTGDNLIYTDNTFKYNPGTGILTVGDAVIGSVTGNLIGNVTGSLFGNADTATAASTVTLTSTDGANATHYIAFTDATSGDKAIRNDISLTYNPFSNTLTAGTFSGTFTSSGTGTFASLTTTNVSTANFFGTTSITSNVYSGISSLLSLTQAHTTADARNVSFFRARGTTTAPTTISNGDDIADIVFLGYGTSAYVGAASISVTVEDVGISNSSMQSSMRFSVNDPAGPSGFREAMAIETTGQLTVNHGLSTGSLRLVENNITTVNSNEDIVFDPSGTGTVDFVVTAQSTVGSAGIASALPATPSTYFKIKVNGVEYVVPAYAVS
jgi:hypothetical protein